MTVLILVGRYLPGYRSGGHIRPIANMVARLGDEYTFRIVTADRDLGYDAEPYPDVRQGEWQRVGKAEVYYVPTDDHPRQHIARVLRSEEWDVLYLNGFHNPLFTAYPLWLRRLLWLPDHPSVGGNGNLNGP